MKISLFAPLIIDIAGYHLTPEDREVLAHPLVGGVILFTRNFEDLNQLRQLVQSIHAIKSPRLHISIDHEGGRVQRIRQPLTELPPLASIGKIYDTDPQKAVKIATELGWLMASELLAFEIDLSFAPVLDLGLGVSDVVADRAFHPDPKVIIALASAYIDGMQQAGMHATGKHFPGHGSVKEDTHLEVVTDDRALKVIEQNDLVPFKALSKKLSAVMPAHVIYSNVDKLPAGFSKRWVQDILCKQCGFEGLVISDDLSMHGASRDKVAITDAVFKANEAGCDVMLICNDRNAVAQVLSDSSLPNHLIARQSIENLYGTSQVGWEALKRSERWQQAKADVSAFS